MDIQRPTVSGHGKMTLEKKILLPLLPGPNQTGILSNTNLVLYTELSLLPETVMIGTCCHIYTSHNQFVGICWHGSIENEL